MYRMLYVVAKSSPMDIGQIVWDESVTLFVLDEVHYFLVWNIVMLIIKLYIFWLK